MKDMLKNVVFQRFPKIGQYAFECFFFVLPFQIRTLIATPLHYSSGNFLPWQASFLTFSDLLLFIAFLCFGLNLQKNRKQNIKFGPSVFIQLFLLFVILVEMQNIIFQKGGFSSLLILLKILEWFGLYLLLINEWVPMKKLIKIFIGGMVIQSIIAVLQAWFQHDIGLSFLGEPEIANNLAGIAKIDLMETKLIRSYGTLPHPNVFAGLAVFSIFFTLTYWQKTRQKTWLIGLQIGALLLTFSRSGLIAITGAMILSFLLVKPNITLKNWVKKGIIIGITTILILLMINAKFIAGWVVRWNLTNLNTQGLQERIEYITAGWKMIQNSPILGMGLGNFTEFSQMFTEKKLAPWEYQPVHNAFLLVGSELGIIGLILFLSTLVIVLKSILKERKKFARKEEKKFIWLLYFIFLATILLFLFDHYLITIYQGQILLIILISILVLEMEKVRKTIGKIKGTSEKRDFVTKCADKF